MTNSYEFELDHLMIEKETLERALDHEVRLRSEAEKALKTAKKDTDLIYLIQEIKTTLKEVKAQLLNREDFERKILLSLEKLESQERKENPAKQRVQREAVTYDEEVPRYSSREDQSRDQDLDYSPSSDTQSLEKLVASRIQRIEVLARKDQKSEFQQKQLQALARQKEKFERLIKLRGDHER